MQLNLKLDSGLTREQANERCEHFFCLTIAVVQNDGIDTSGFGLISLILDEGRVLLLTFVTFFRLEEVGTARGSIFTSGRVVPLKAEGKLVSMSRQLVNMFENGAVLVILVEVLQDNILILDEIIIGCRHDLGCIDVFFTADFNLDMSQIVSFDLTFDEELTDCDLFSLSSVFSRLEAKQVRGNLFPCLIAVDLVSLVSLVGRHGESEHLLGHSRWVMD